jgi:NodT family efflux transporter outer membrane factor (OMF) lipoprotein
MKKHKILTLLIAIIFSTSTNIAFCAEIKNNEKVKPSKQLKAALTDYKAEYLNSDWWGKFHDPVLKGYIEKASTSNYDFKIASLKVLETQEVVKEYLGKEFPLISFNANMSRQTTSNNSSMGSFSLKSYTQNSFFFPLNVNYELDLWKKNRDRTIQAAKELEVVKYEEKAAYISLVSAVASTYFQVTNLDKQIDLQKEIINIRKKVLELTKESCNYGLYQPSDVLLKSKALEEANSQLSDLEKFQSILLNQLAIITGSSSDNSSALQRSSIDEINLISDIPSSVNSEVVQKRPDILKAEAEIQKAKIDVSLARKEYLPDINLLGQFGFNANSFSKAYDWNSHVLSGGLGLAEKIFSGGQRHAVIKSKNFKYQQMMENYQKTVLTSFQEVNDSLASLKSDTQKNENNISRIRSEKQNLAIINNKYQYGAISYLDTLQHKENMLVLEKEQLQSKTNCLIDSLSFYKSVGGKL